MAATGRRRIFGDLRIGINGKSAFIRGHRELIASEVGSLAGESRVEKTQLHQSIEASVGVPHGFRLRLRRRNGAQRLNGRAFIRRPYSFGIDSWSFGLTAT